MRDDFEYITFYNYLDTRCYRGTRKRGLLYNLNQQKKICNNSQKNIWEGNVKEGFGETSAQDFEESEDFNYIELKDKPGQVAVDFLEIDEHEEFESNEEKELGIALGDDYNYYFQNETVKIYDVGSKTKIHEITKSKHFPYITFDELKCHKIILIQE